MCKCKSKRPYPRKQFVYRGVVVTPRPEMFWAIRSVFGPTWRLIKTKARVKRVIDALID